MVVLRRLLAALALSGAVCWGNAAIDHWQQYSFLALLPLAYALNILRVSLVGSWLQKMRE